MELFYHELMTKCDAQRFYASKFHRFYFITLYVVLLVLWDENSFMRGFSFNGSSHFNSYLSCLVVTQSS